MLGGGGERAATTSTWIAAYARADRRRRVGCAVLLPLPPAVGTGGGAGLARIDASPAAWRRRLRTRTAPYPEIPSRFDLADPAQIRVRPRAARRRARRPPSKPVLGICYGMQLLALEAGGRAPPPRAAATFAGAARPRRRQRGTTRVTSIDGGGGLSSSRILDRNGSPRTRQQPPPPGRLGRGPPLQVVAAVAQRRR